MSCVQGSHWARTARRFACSRAPAAVVSLVTAVLACSCAIAIGVAAGAGAGVASAGLSPQELSAAASEVRHFEYVFDDGTFYVYDMDSSQQLVQTVSLPQTEAGVRGVTVAPASHLLFISYGGDSAGFSGSVLAYNLVTEQVVWTVHLRTGIDSGQVSPDGSRLYMPTGELTPSGIWNVLDTSNGAVIGTIQGGSGAHNTIASNDGRYVYLGGREYNYLDVYDTATEKVRGVGPLINTVRPFTVNAANTLAFTTATEFDGFQVSSITAGKVLFTVSFGAVPKGFAFTGPSHGASLSPDERQLYVIDSPNKKVRVYNVSRVAEGIAPTELGAIPVAGLSGTETPCAYDCGRGGWLQHSLDGRFVYVGDSGEVIDTATRQVLSTLPPLLNTKKTLEVDWAAGAPVATSGRTGVGYGTGSSNEPPPGGSPEELPPGGPSAKPATPGSTLLGAASLTGAPLTSPLVAPPGAGAGSVAGFHAAPVASIRRLSLFPRAFQALAGNSARAWHGAVRTGAIVRFEDSQAATTTFSVISLGRAAGGSPHACAGAARRRPCSAGVKIGSFVHRDRAGWNRLVLSGWVRARKLVPGVYRLVAAPKLAGRVGVGSAIGFQILA
jgi:WD40 repeat protein